MRIKRQLKLKSVGEGDHVEEEIPSIIEDEVQIIPPPAPAQQTLTFIKILEDSAPYYNKLRTKALLFCRDALEV